jgi:tetratricopeptide (TPR) repeat protein
VTGDSHLKPEDEKEVLPWFYTEVAFNPNDVRGYVLGSYWLERVGDKSACIKFLNEGEKNNPDSAEILGAIGEFYLKEGDDEKAMAYLSSACALWIEAKGMNAVSNKYEESDRLFAFDLLADMYTKKGAHKKALQLYRELLKFGANAAISQKITDIEGKL